MSCKSREDGVALADAILFVQARERPLKLTADQLHSVHTSVTEILLSNTKANHHNAFEFLNVAFKIF